MTELATLLNDHIIGNNTFLMATFSGINRSGLENEWNKITVKPVLIKNVAMFQFNYYDNVKGIAKNYSPADTRRELSTIAQAGFKSIYVRHENEGVQIQITKKGALLVKKHKESNTKPADLSHDKKKKRLIQPDSEDAYLTALGLNDANGNIKPSMQGKFKQINEFVNIVDKMQDWKEWNNAVSVVDCGSGDAYLTFAMYHYFKNILGKETVVRGIDINPELIEKNNARAKDLNWGGIDFEFSNIAGFTPETPPTITLALHACDTATDEALMKGIIWQSGFILSVPCCHHNLQVRLKDVESRDGFKGVMKHGILRERQADILTDSFRALILEIMGYKTDVIQYVTTEHTARNLLIRAKKISDKPLPHAVKQYRDLKEFWNVTPILEEIMADTSDFKKRIA